MDSDAAEVPTFLPFALQVKACILSLQRKTSASPAGLSAKDNAFMLLEDISTAADLVSPAIVSDPIFLSPDYRSLTRVS